MNSWILWGGRVAQGPRKTERLDLEIRSGKIAAMSPSLKMIPGAGSLDLRGCLVLPGLINAHDHLEFNLFPRLGRGPYANAGSWARDIYLPGQSPVKEHLRIPLATRLRWGAVKNLLSGVTTVCHHNPYNAAVFGRNFPVRVPRRYGWAHSLEFSPDLVERFRRTPSERPFILHLGEAVDRRGRQEIWRLDQLGALDRRTVLVHGVALGKRGLRLVLERGASLVWCPSSNMFLLGRTLDRASLESGVPAALGTDSALTSTRGLLEEARFARKVARIPSARLYEMMTCESARIMRLGHGEGCLTPGGTADLLIVRDVGRSPASTLLELRPGEMDLVFLRGGIKLSSGEYLGRLPAAVRRSLLPLTLRRRGRRTVFVAADLPTLFRHVESSLGAVVLAGMRMSRSA